MLKIPLVLTDPALWTLQNTFGYSSDQCDEVTLQRDAAGREPVK